MKTAAAIFLSPALGFVLALALILLVSWLFVWRTPGGVDALFRIPQFASASLYSIDHAAFRRNRLNADDVIDSKSLERALREKPASTFSPAAL